MTTTCELPASASQELGLPVCTTIPDCSSLGWLDEPVASGHVIWDSGSSRMSHDPERDASLHTCNYNNMWPNTMVSWASLPNPVAGLYLCSWFGFWLMFTRLCSFFYKKPFSVKKMKKKRPTLLFFLLPVFLMSITSGLFLPARYIFNMANY